MRKDIFQAHYTKATVLHVTGHSSALYLICHIDLSPTESFGLVTQVRDWRAFPERSQTTKSVFNNLITNKCL